MEDRRLIAVALSNVAGARLSAGRLPEAAAAVGEALHAHRAQGNRSSTGNALRLTAALSLEQGNAGAARQAIDEALDIALALRDHTLEGYWLLTLGDVQRSEGQYGEALASYQRSAMLHRRLGDRSREALAWRGAGQAYAEMGRSTEAARTSIGGPYPYTAPSETPGSLPWSSTSWPPPSTRRTRAPPAPTGPRPCPTCPGMPIPGPRLSVRAWRICPAAGEREAGAHWRYALPLPREGPSHPPPL
ncbi:hypothetical protein [Streptomyces sp. NBC_01525]|uniref:hypothetical protein n=1 Tax=Streptomyces sp. NBC_01525 TaxID=2903893 RepID=UPI0038686D29